jgi:hypothetical protein
MSKKKKPLRLDVTIITDAIRAARSLMGTLPEIMKQARPRWKLMEYELDPPNADKRRNKKRECLTDEETLLRAFAIDAFTLNDPSYIKYWIDKAVETKDPEVFRVIAKVAEDMKMPSRTITTQRVIKALKAEIQLMETQGELPTKQEIKKETGLDLDDQRWYDIHKAAGQLKNPKTKPKRGKERHGDNRLRKPPKN